MTHIIQINKSQVNYDKRHDVLHVFIHPEKLSEDEEIYPDIIVRKSVNDEQITGFTLLDYSNIDQNVLANLYPQYSFPSIETIPDINIRNKYK